MQLLLMIKRFGQTLPSLFDSGCFSQTQYEPDFKHIEDNPGVTVILVDTAVRNASKERSRKLFLILGGRNTDHSKDRYMTRMDWRHGGN